MEFPVLSLCNCILRSPRGSRRAVALAAGIALFGAAGCQSIPRLHSPSGVAWTVASAPELIDESEKPLFAAAPDFDLPAELSPAVAASTSALTPASAAPVAAAAASSEPEKLSAASAPVASVAAAPAAVPVPSATPQQPAGKSVEDKAVAVATETLKQATGANSSNGKDAGSTAASNSVETTVAKVAQQPPK
jgi:ribonuclease E